MAERGAYKYTVVIPSRNRQRYCVEAAQTALLGERDDVQVIICDNSDDGEDLPRRLKEAGVDDRVLLLPSTGKVLPMKENWERALDHFAGEWLTYIGDDDGFRIDSFEILDYLTDNYVAKCYTWRPIYYKWPCFPEVDHGLLTINYGETGMSVAPTRTYLENHMNWVTDDKWPNAGPSVYHGLVHRSIVDITRKLYGRYFLNFVVDYSSAITNATFIEHFLQYHWDVTIMGACGHSNTAGLTASGTAAKKVREFKIENPELKVMFEDFQTSSLHVPWVAAGYSLLLAELGLPFSMTPHKFFKSCLNELERQRSEESFAEEKARLQRFADQHGLSRQKLDAMQMHTTIKPIGAAMNPLRFYFDTEAFGWKGILDVAKNLQSVKQPFAFYPGPHREVLAKIRAAAPGLARAAEDDIDGPAPVKPEFAPAPSFGSGFNAETGGI
ncbi:MAG: glycosyltransferase family 2 protein [Neomegalonema sp.]|nr:glycosyltransferase family 2 protein [Neomegalonema sp.]